MQRGAEANGRERRQRQWYEFCTKMRESVYNQVAEQIQVLWPYVPQDIVDSLENGLVGFCGSLEMKLFGVRDFQGEVAQGMHQLENDVDNRLIQNDQRDATKEGTIDGLFTVLQNLGGEMGKNHQENIQTSQKVAMAEKQLGGIGKAIEVELSTGMG